MNPFEYQDDEHESHETPPRSRRTKRKTHGRWVVDGKMRIWLILLLAGGGLMLLQFFLPWWQIALHLSDAKRDDLADVGRAMTKNRSWYKSYDLTLDGKDDSKMLFGWNTGTGITAFVFSFFVIGWGIVPWFVRLLKPWAWIGFFVCMIFGLVSFILSLVWYSTAPGTDVGSFLSQFVIVGPYLLIPGSLTVFVGGLLGGIFGLLAFLKSFPHR